MRLNVLSLILLSGILLPPGIARAVTLVEKGQARAIIVMPDERSPIVVNAARVLRDHIKPSCEDLGIPPATWLTFRRTWATWADGKGIIPKAWRVDGPQRRGE